MSESESPKSSSSRPTRVVLTTVRNGTLSQSWSIDQLRGFLNGIHTHLSLVPVEGFNYDFVFRQAIRTFLSGGVITELMAMALISTVVIRRGEQLQANDPAMNEAWAAIDAAESQFAMEEGSDRPTNYGAPGYEARDAAFDAAIEPHHESASHRIDELILEVFNAWGEQAYGSMFWNCPDLFHKLVMDGAMAFDQLDGRIRSKEANEASSNRLSALVAEIVKEADKS